MERQANESPARSVLRHSAMTLGTRVGIVLINIPTSILVARLLGAEGQGSYASAVIFPTLFAFIGLLGVDAAHTYLLSGNRAPVAQINAQSLRLVVVLSLVVTPLYLAFVHLYHGAADPRLASILSLGAAIVPILLAKYLAVALLLGLGRIKWFNIANAVQAAALLGLMCLNFFVFKGGVRGAVTVYMLSEVTVTGIAIVVARREVGAGPLFETPAPGLFRRSIVYALQGHVGNVLIQFSYRFDMFLVLSMVGLAGQGLYSIAVVLAEKLSHIPQSVQVVLFPKLSSLPVAEVDRLTPRVLRSSLFATAVAGAVLFLVSRPLLLLFYGTPYLPALRAFQVLIPGIVALSIAKILAGDFSGRDRRIYHTIGTAIGFGVNLALCLVWIPRAGIEGAAWASTVAYTVQSVVVLVFFRKLSGNGILESTVIRGEDLKLYWGHFRARMGR
jgi:O-antigen/teichoic acid export membrane protein